MQKNDCNNLPLAQPNYGSQLSNYTCIIICHNKGHGGRFAAMHVKAHDLQPITYIESGHVINIKSRIARLSVNIAQL